MVLLINRWRRNCAGLWKSLLSLDALDWGWDVY